MVMTRARKMLSIHQKTFRDQFAMESRDERGKSLLARTGGLLKASVAAAVAPPEYEIRRGKTPVAILSESGSLDIGADHASIIIDGSSYELSRALPLAAGAEQSGVRCEIWCPPLWKRWERAALPWLGRR